MSYHSANFIPYVNGSLTFVPVPHPPYLTFLLICFFCPVLDEEEVLLAEETLSNHTDLVDNEPIANEARKKFIRLVWSV